MMNKFIKCLLCHTLVILMIISFAACGKEETSTQDFYIPKDNPNAYTEPLSGEIHAAITVKGYGKISLKLYADIAPITVTNFVNLAIDGFYDGLTFHRIIDEFMIQGGCPEGTGLGGSGVNIKGEFSANGVENGIKHERGVISMARSKPYNSASSQFFIITNTENSTHLNGQYAAFGRVTSGIEVVDAIAKNTPVYDNNGSTNPSDRPIIETIEILNPPKTN